jgi:hypothetical protein
MLLWVCHPCCPKCSGPEKGTHARPGSDPPGPDPDAIAKSSVGPDLGSINIVAIIHGRGMRVLKRGEIVGRHRLHRLAREETHPIQFSPAQQHPPETLVIVNRRNEASSPGWEEWRIGPARVLWMIPHGQFPSRRFSGGTTKLVSTMARGVKIRSCKNVSSGCSATRATRTPSTSAAVW